MSCCCVVFVLLLCCFVLLLCCVVIVVVVSCGCGFGLRRTTLRQTTLRRTAQNFALFLPFPATVSLFLCLSGCLLVEFRWCLRRRSPQMCTFGVLGLSCEAPGSPVVPSAWKSSPVVPLLKRDGDPTFFNSYRPISLASCAFKVLEHLVHARIAPHISPQLDVSQGGFRRGADTLVCSLVDSLRLRHQVHTLGRSLIGSSP